jgi:RNA polymerase sigma-70 factor, ECF subfamily
MERELVVRAQGGDPDAFGALATEAVDRLHGVAYRILRDEDAAQEATQRALIAAWDHIRSLRDPARWRAWTYRLVVREAYHEARRERVYRARVRFVMPASAAQPDSSNEVAERDEIEHAFRALTPEQQAVLVLHHYADLPLTEISSILGIPVGTVGSRLYYAARRLRAALEGEAPVFARGT